MLLIHWYKDPCRFLWMEIDNSMVWSSKPFWVLNTLYYNFRCLFFDDYTSEMTGYHKKSIKVSLILNFRVTTRILWGKLYICKLDRLEILSDVKYVFNITIISACKYKERFEELIKRITSNGYWSISYHICVWKIISSYGLLLQFYKRSLFCKNF